MGNYLQRGHAMQEDISRRLQFLGIDESLKKTLKEAKPFIDAHLPAILDGFYKHIGTYEEVSGMFTEPSIMEHAKAKQIEHWQHITSAKLDADYVASVSRIGRTHNQLGLEPRWYMGGYAYILNAITRAVSEHLKDSWKTNNTAKRAAWLTALNTVIMLDMDLAISVYLKKTR